MGTDRSLTKKTEALLGFQDNTVTEANKIIQAVS
jgi:hypothetical protein